MGQQIHQMVFKPACFDQCQPALLVGEDDQIIPRMDLHDLSGFFGNHDLSLVVDRDSTKQMLALWRRQDIRSARKLLLPVQIVQSGVVKLR